MDGKESCLRGGKTSPTITRKQSETRVLRPDPERRPGYTVGRMFSHLIVEESQHLGQVAYLRGLLRGLEYTTSWPSPRTPFPDSSRGA